MMIVQKALKKQSLHQAWLIWLAAQWIGPAVGLPGRFALLIDLAALAAFVWAFYAIYNLWRARQDES